MKISIIHNQLQRAEPVNRIEVQFVYSFSAIGILSTGVFGLYNLFYMDFGLGIFELAFCFAGIFNLLFFFVFKRVGVASSIMLLIMVFQLSALVITGGIGGTGVLWFFTFPALTFFLRGKKEALVWNVNLFAIVFVLYVLGLAGFIRIYYSFIELRQLTVVYIAVSTIILFYRMINDRYRALIEEKTTELTNTNKSLTEEIEHRKKADAEFLGKNVFLQKTKLAMLNILEDQKKTEADLRKSAEELNKFKLAVENAHEHIVITDSEGVILYANKAVANITGYSQAEILGKTPALWGKKMPLEFYKNMWNTIKTKKQTFIGEINNKKKNGDDYVAAVSISPILDEKNNVKFFVGIEKDITIERKLTEDLKNEKEVVEAKVVERTGQLVEETARLQSSISSLNVGFIITTVDQSIFLINAAAKKIVGSESAGMVDIIKKFKGGVDIAAQMSDCMTKKHAFEIKSLQIENEYFHIFISPITISKKNTQEVIGTVMFIDDITEAERLERTRDEFFSIASHELRTPITAIKGNTALIQQYYFDKFKDKDLKGMIVDIHDSSTRLIEIVNDFLDVSRLEQGRITYRKQATDVAGIIETVIKELQPVGVEKNVQAVFEKRSSSLPPVVADPDKVKQVLINLIGNAFKFTEKGKITVLVEVDPKGFVKILVADTGRGIPSANQNLLFRKFQQAGSSILTRDTTKGTGLGLYISKLMIEGMNGKIQLESSVEGKGSTFSFSLPVATDKNTRQKDQSGIDIKTGLTQKVQT